MADSTQDTLDYTYTERPHEVIILRGLPASGKTTWATALIQATPYYKRVNKDDLRAMLDAGVYSPDNELFVRRVRDSIILDAIAHGYSVIVDDTNLNPGHIDHIRTLVASFIIAVRVVDVLCPVEDAIARDAARPRPVGAERIRAMAEQYQDTVNHATQTATSSLD